MKTFTLLLGAALLLLTHNIYAQEKEYFKIYTPNNSLMQHKEKSDNEFTDLYTVYTDSTHAVMKYVLGITVLKNSPLTMDDITAESFKQDVHSKCNCDIIKDTKTSYANFNAVRYTETMKVNGVDLNGYSINTCYNGTFYSIVILMKGKNGIETYEPELDGILNSLVFF